MEKMIAYCGLICNECPAFIATKHNDTSKKEELAEKWADPGKTLQPYDITCYGCKNPDKKTQFCQICYVRKCCINKKIENCAHCPEYPCSKYEVLIKKIDSPEAKELLDAICAAK